MPGGFERPRKGAEPTGIARSETTATRVDVITRCLRAEAPPTAPRMRFISISRRSR